MKPTTLLLGASTALASAIPHARTVNHRIPTSKESAVMARRILALSPLGTLATIFPPSSGGADAAENRPSGVEGMPHGLMEYISDCESSSVGDPTLLALNIETSFKNIAAGSNVSLAVQWTPPHPPARHHSFFSQHHDGDDDESQPHGAIPYSPASLPRFSLLGHVEKIPGGDDRSAGAPGVALAKCFTASHPDARWWLPGNRIHESHFVRLVVEQIYWIGGFGDRAFIGWIPIDEYKQVTKEEWEAIRLPGEEKEWKEWKVQGAKLGDL